MKHQEPYPYPLHTNRELEMMLAGEKPFAMFAHEQVQGFEKSDALANQDFATHVANGTLSEHVRTFKAKGPDGTVLDIDYYMPAGAKNGGWRPFACLSSFYTAAPGARSWNGCRESCSAIPKSRTGIT